MSSISILQQAEVFNQLLGSPLTSNVMRLPRLIMNEDFAWIFLPHAKFSISRRQNLSSFQSGQPFNKGPHTHQQLRHDIENNKRASERTAKPLIEDDQLLERNGIIGKEGNTSPVVKCSFFESSPTVIFNLQLTWDGSSQIWRNYQGSLRFNSLLHHSPFKFIFIFLSIFCMDYTKSVE